jgi:hypothetical protein
MEVASAESLQVSRLACIPTSDDIDLACNFLDLWKPPSSTLSARNRIDFVALTEQRRGFRGQKNRKPCGGTSSSL